MPKKYRSRDELPNPNINASAEENRLDVKIAFRESAEFNEKLNDIVSKLHITKKQFLVEASKKHAKDLGFDID